MVFSNQTCLFLSQSALQAALNCFDGVEIRQQRGGDRLQKSAQLLCL